MTRHSLSRRAVLLAAAALPHTLARSGTQSVELRNKMEELAREHGICAATFATITAGTPDLPELVVGCKSVDGVSASSIFQAASLSKPVVAYGVLKLVAQAKLDLDASVARYLPEGYIHRSNPFENNRPPVTDKVAAADLKEVTIRSLLNHSSGLPNWSSGPLTLDFRPGSSWQYSGEGYALLQRVVEVVASGGLEEFMQRQVFKPLAMDSSGFRWNDAFSDRIVPGTVMFGRAWQHRFPEPIAAASLCTTAGDYAKFMAALLRDESALRLTTAAPVSANARPRLDWGLGWGIEHLPSGPCIWQWGNNTGYRAFAMVSISSGDGFVLFTNSERGLLLAEPLANLVIPSEHPSFQFRMLR